MHSKKVSFGGQNVNVQEEGQTDMIFQQMDDAESGQSHHQRTTSFNHNRRRTEKGLRPVSVSKMELAQKLT